MLEASEGAIDLNSVFKHNIGGNTEVTECPYTYEQPPLTVAIQAGLEKAVVGGRGTDAGKMKEFMSQEDELCQLVGLMLQKGANANATGTETQDCESGGSPTVHGKTPLCAAAQRGSLALVKMLLEAGADPSHTHKYDSTAYGADTQNPLGPGVLKPESWTMVICNGSVRARGANDPRNESTAEILALLHAAA